MQYKLRTLLILTALVAVSTVWSEDWLNRSYGGDTPAQLLGRIQTTTEVRRGGDVVSNRITYSVGNYGVTEFGNVRLAVEGKPFSGRSSGFLLLATKSSDGSDIFSRTGVGNRRFENRTIAGGSACKFAGLSFEIFHGKLRLLDRTVPVDDKPKLIIVNSKGKIDDLVELPIDAPE